MNPRPYDSSQLKNTDLLKYVLNRELENHRTAAEELDKKKDPEFLWQFFSALLAILVWQYGPDAKDENVKKVLWILGVYLVGYYVLYKLIIRNIIIYAGKWLSWLRSRIIGIPSHVLTEEEKAGQLIHYFQQITLNKLALAHSLLFDANAATEDLLKQQYVIECLGYLSSATSELVPLFAEGNLKFIEKHPVVKARLKSYVLKNAISISNYIADELEKLKPIIKDEEFMKDLVNAKGEIAHVKVNLAANKFI